jgi:hypothetical protein
MYIIDIINLGLGIKCTKNERNMHAFMHSLLLKYAKYDMYKKIFILIIIFETSLV